MHVLHNARTHEQFDSAVAYFQQAVDENPADALAWAGLAGCYVTLGHDLGIGDPELWANVRAAAERAIRLDSTSAEGWAALADYKTYSERDWEGAEQAFRKANELNPSLAWNHYHYSWYLILFGRLEEAVAEHERAKALDPLTPYHTTWLPALYWFSGDFDRAYAEARELVEGPYTDDPIANLVFARSAAFAGLFEEAITVYERIADPHTLFFVILGEANALADRREEALRIAREVERRLDESLMGDLSASGIRGWNAEGLFCLYAALGNREEALRWLEYEPTSFSLPWVWAYPQVEALRDEPRLQAVFRRMNLRLEPGDRYPVPLPLVPADLPASHNQPGR